MLLLMHFLRRLRRTVKTRLELKVLLFVFVFISFGSLGFYTFEHPHRPELTVADSFWWAIVTMTTVGYGDIAPVTTAGRFFIAIPSMIAGGGILAYALSVVTTYLIEAKDKELRGLNTYRYRNHIVLINHPGEAKVVEMVHELRHDKETEDRPIVLLSDQPSELSETLAKLNVHFVRGSPINQRALERAALAKASDAILFARSERDENSDSFNLGVLVALGSLNPKLRIVVECVSPVHKELMLKAGADTAICVTELSTELLAQARQGVKIQELFTELASNRTPQQVDSVPFEHGHEGKIDFGELGSDLAKESMLLIGVRQSGKLHVNPGHSFQVGTGDLLLLISAKRPKQIRHPA